MSPWSRFPSQTTYWVRNGLSSPSSSLAASTTSWEISLPVFSIFCSTTSLPAIRIMPKDKNVIASRMGINCSKRLPIYFFIRTLSSISFKYNEYNSFSQSSKPRAGVLYPFRFSYDSFHFVIAFLQNCQPRWLPASCVKVPGCMEL